MEQHEIVAARFQDGPINELYAIVGRNNKDREALTEWIQKHVHRVTLTITGKFEIHEAKYTHPSNGTYQVSWDHHDGTRIISFDALKL